MGDQVNMTIAREVIYKSDEIDGIMPFALTFIGPQMLECIICKGIDARVAFSKGFLVDFPAKQYSQVGKLILVIWPNKSSLASLFILFCPIWPSSIMSYNIINITSNSHIRNDNITII